MIFIDASALVAIISAEPDADALSDRLERHERRFCSAISLWETTAALSHSRAYTVPSARAEVAQFVKVGDLIIVSIGASELHLATEAYARFGKGRHEAALNMGDCFAYACAKANDAKLLFKGNDFTKTDISAA